MGRDSKLLAFVTSSVYLRPSRAYLFDDPSYRTATPSWPYCFSPRFASAPSSRRSKFFRGGQQFLSLVESSLECTTSLAEFCLAPKPTLQKEGSQTRHTVLVLLLAQWCG